MKDDGSSVLDRRAAGRLLLSWCALFLHGCKAALAWGLILYVLCAIWASSSHAAIVCQPIIVTDPPPNTTALDTLRQVYDIIPGYGGTVSACLSGSGPHYSAWLSNCGGHPTPPANCTGAAQVQYGSASSTCNSGDLCHAWAWAVSQCPEGEEPDPVTGECVVPNPCSDASQDDYSESFTTSVNPGLCEVGDVAQVSQQQLCGYSETANATCEYSYTGTATYVALGEFTIYESLNFAATPCTTPTNPDPFEPADCAPPPPTCPPDQYPREDGQGGWECVDPQDPGEPDPDLDQETPPANQTASRETTVTETTTTTNNPDGSVTTTTTRTETIGDCPPGEVCVQEIDYEGPGDRVGDTKTFGESLLAFYAAIEEAPLVNAANGISDAIPESSTCPTWTSDNIPILDDTVTVDGHCLAIEGHEETLRGLMLVVWSLTALFILLSS